MPQMKPVRGRALVAAVAMLALATACGYRQPLPQRATRPATTLRVENSGFSDVTVWVLRGTERVRLGIAGGTKATTFTIPSELLPGPTLLRFLADPLARSTRQPTVQERTVQPGDYVVMTVPP